jgi:hypothetical protein
MVSGRPPSGVEEEFSRRQWLRAIDNALVAQPRNAGPGVDQAQPGETIFDIQPKASVMAESKPEFPWGYGFVERRVQNAVENGFSTARAGSRDCFDKQHHSAKTWKWSRKIVQTDQAFP